MMYIAKIEDNIVMQVIVGASPKWAKDVLGGDWVVSEELVGIGWIYDGNFKPSQQDYVAD